MNDKKNKQEKVTDVKGTIIGFVAPDPEEKTQEQEIEEFKIKKETEKELAKLSEEEQKKKREEYEEEEKKLEVIKIELLKSIKERIPKIEEKFKINISNSRKGNVVEKIESKTLEKIEEKEANLNKNENQVEKERE